MEEIYFTYVLSQCKTQSIVRVCSVAASRRTLLKKASEDIIGCRNIVSDEKLLKAVEFILYKGGIIDPELLDYDAKTIYFRCKNKLSVFYQTQNYDDLFECLVDLNWLLASMTNKIKGKIRLLSSPDKIVFNIKCYLQFLYNQANSEYNECLHIQDARAARKRIFIGLYKFKYNESKRYIERDDDYRFIISDEELDNLEMDYKEHSICNMSLFYGLTATAALADNIWRSDDGYYG